MTPTPREDTMAEQTDQIIERMRTRAMVAGQCSVEAPDNVHSSMAAAEAEFLTECADLLAAQVRERDAAILRYQTAELEQNAVIARLSAHVEDAEQRYRVTYTSLCDQAAQAVTLRAERDALQVQVDKKAQAFDDECGRHEQTLIGKRGFADLVAQLGAERDAAQQTLERCREVQQATAEAWRIEHEEMAPFLKDGETPAECIARNRADTDAAMSLLAQSKQQIATLTEALTKIRDFAEGSHPSAPMMYCFTAASAALSTRPQEQPSEPDFIDIEPDIRVVRVYRDGSWLEDVKAGGRRRASFPLAIHQQGGHQP